MQTYRNSILPLFAIVLAVLGVTYTACNDSKADTGNESPASELRQEVNHFGQEVEELRTLHEGHIKSYGEEMGCMSNSKALEVINHHNELLEHLTKRLEYHKLQLIQADTSNAVRNRAQLEELKKDEVELSKDGDEIRNGLDQFVPTHATK